MRVSETDPSQYQLREHGKPGFHYNPDRQGSSYQEALWQIHPMTNSRNAWRSWKA